MPYKSRQRRLTYLQKYYRKNRQKRLRDSKKYYRKNKQRISLKKKIYRKRTCPVLRVLVFRKYCRGKIRCQCKGCPIVHISLLTLDHIKPIKDSDRALCGEKLNAWIISHDFPKGFQVLCGSCNLAKGTKHRCPRYGKKH